MDSSTDVNKKITSLTENLVTAKESLCRYYSTCYLCRLTQQIMQCNILCSTDIKQSKSTLACYTLEIQTFIYWETSRRQQAAVVQPLQIWFAKNCFEFCSNELRKYQPKSEGKFNESFLAQTKYIETQAGAPVGTASACSRNAGAQINKWFFSFFKDKRGIFFDRSKNLRNCGFFFLSTKVRPDPEYRDSAVLLIARISILHWNRGLYYKTFYGCN